MNPAGFMTASRDWLGFAHCRAAEGVLQQRTACRRQCPPIGCQGTSFDRQSSSTRRQWVPIEDQRRPDAHHRRPRDGQATRIRGQPAPIGCASSLAPLHRLPIG